MLPKILLLDVETTPNLSYTWGKYEQNVIAFKKESELLCFVCKWLDEKNVLVFDRRKGYKTMLRQLWKLLNKADIVIAHNGDRFDIRKINAAFLERGLPPPSPYKTVDTKKVAKRYFFLNSNKLDDLGKMLKLGEKLKHEGFSLWLGCMKNDPKSWENMLKYNIQDVLLLEKIYIKLLPWINNHPNLTNITGEITCPKCGGRDSYVSKTRYFKQGIKQQRKCKNCFGYFTMPLKGGMPVSNV